MSDWQAKIHPQKLPRHVGIIMDGNGRWAALRHLPRNFGHRAGMKTLKEIVICCSELGIETLTVFAFSTENWKRPLTEVNFLMGLLAEYIERELSELKRKNVKISILGDLDHIPSRIQNEIDRAVSETASNQGLVLNIAFNYGARQEIVQAIQAIAAKVAAGEIRAEEINEQMVNEYLFTKGLPDPDLIIRPSGELRLSNFLLWQSAYTEFWFDRVLWPDFSRQDFCRAIVEFQQRHRRFGGL